MGTNPLLLSANPSEVVCIWRMTLRRCTAFSPVVELFGSLSFKPSHGVPIPRVGGVRAWVPQYCILSPMDGSG
jgi:hypothetical protein